MSPDETASLSWGSGDLLTLGIAVVVFVASCIIHRKAIYAAKSNSRDLLGGIMADSLCVGPLLMILLDPLNKKLGLFNIDLLQTILKEARISLWLAAFLALAGSIQGLLRSR